MDIYFGSFIFQILAFAILLLLLKKYAFGPIIGMMEKRQQVIADQMNSAEKNHAEAEKLLQEQKELIQQSRIEAQEIIENAKSISTNQATEILEKAKSESERMKEQALQEIKLEKEKAVAELREQISTLSVMIASKIIEKEIDEKTQSKLVDEMMKQVGESI